MGFALGILEDYYEPSVTFPVYTPLAGDAVLKVYSDSLLVQEQPIKLHKGLSYYTYKLEMKEDAVDPLIKQILDKNLIRIPSLRKRRMENITCPRVSIAWKSK